MQPRDVLWQVRDSVERKLLEHWRQLKRWRQLIWGFLRKCEIWKWSSPTSRGLSETRLDSLHSSRWLLWIKFARCSVSPSIKPTWITTEKTSHIPHNSTNCDSCKNQQTHSPAGIVSNQFALLLISHFVQAVFFIRPSPGNWILHNRLLHLSPSSLNKIFKWQRVSTVETRGLRKTYTTALRGHFEDLCCFAEIFLKKTGVDNHKSCVGIW